MNFKLSDGGSEGDLQLFSSVTVKTLKACDEISNSSGAAKLS